MDLGLYQLKYPVRRLIGGVVPMLRGVHPDIVSWSILPVGVATAICYFFADLHPVLRCRVWGRRDRQIGWRRWSFFQ
jgi:hypothetical protein